mgnify:CR=1 FL=1
MSFWSSGCTPCAPTSRQAISPSSRRSCCSTSSRTFATTSSMRAGWMRPSATSRSSDTPRDLAAHGIERRQDHRLGRVVDDHVDAGDDLERADVAALAADDAPLHVVARQLHDGHARSRSRGRRRSAGSRARSPCAPRARHCAARSRGSPTARLAASARASFSIDCDELLAGLVGARARRCARAARSARRAARPAPSAATARPARARRCRSRACLRSRSFLSISSTRRLNAASFCWNARSVSSWALRACSISRLDTPASCASASSRPASTASRLAASASRRASAAPAGRAARRSAAGARPSCERTNQPSANATAMPPGCQRADPRVPERHGGSPGSPVTGPKQGEGALHAPAARAHAGTHGNGMRRVVLRARAVKRAGMPGAIGPRPGSRPGARLSASARSLDSQLPARCLVARSLNSSSAMFSEARIATFETEATGSILRHLTHLAVHELGQLHDRITRVGLACGAGAADRGSAPARRSCRREGVPVAESEGCPSSLSSRRFFLRWLVELRPLRHRRAEGVRQRHEVLQLTRGARACAEMASDAGGHVAALGDATRAAPLERGELAEQGAGVLALEPALQCP